VLGTIEHCASHLFAGLASTVHAKFEWLEHTLALTTKRQMMLNLDWRKLAKVSGYH
jgi:hypothetical protein